jgi:outer membrane protein TolC
MNAALTAVLGTRVRTRALALALAVFSLTPALGAQQPRPLSLDEAIRLAAKESEALQIARAGVARANGQIRQARSAYYPQISPNFTYARTLQSQFSALASSTTVDSGANNAKAVCAPSIPANATPAERAAILGQATTCAAAGSIDFSKVGFGARNAYTFGLQVNQNVFTGGRIAGQAATAKAGERAAQIEVTAQRAQLALDVTQAYFDAQLADRLVAIADTSLAQTEELLRQTQVARQVGNVAEFDLLRAQVTRDNQRPIVAQREGDRDVAYFRLKQLLNVPLDTKLSLTTSSEDPAALTSVIARNAADTSAVHPSSDTTTAHRAPVRESEQSVVASEGQLKVARADRYPQVTLNSGFQRLYFPATLFPSLNQGTENWTVGGNIQWALFTGGRTAGQVEVAQANLDEAKARLQQAREFAELDTRVALNQLASADAAFQASRGTSQQAARAYSIDQLRYREGLSTQTDLTQSRLLLEQATANQALSARDLAVARARVALIRDLPINTAALGVSSQRAALQAQQSLTQTVQQQRAQSSAAATGAGLITGGITP